MSDINPTQGTDIAFFETFGVTTDLPPQTQKRVDDMVKTRSLETTTVSFGDDHHEIQIGKLLGCLKRTIESAKASGYIVPATVIGSSKFRAFFGFLDPQYLTVAEADVLVSDDDPRLVSGAATRGRPRKAKAGGVGRPRRQPVLDKAEIHRQKLQVIVKECLEKAKDWGFTSIFQCFQHQIALELGIAREDKQYPRAATKTYQWLAPWVGDTSRKMVRHIGRSKHGSILPVAYELRIVAAIERQFKSFHEVQQEDVSAAIQWSLSYIRCSFESLGEKPPGWLVDACKPGVHDHIVRTFKERWNISFGMARGIIPSRVSASRTAALLEWRTQTVRVIMKFREEFYPGMPDEEFAHLILNSDETYGQLGAKRKRSLKMRGIYHAARVDTVATKMCSMMATVNGAGTKFPLHCCVPQKSAKDLPDVIESIDGISDDEMVKTYVYNSPTGYFNKDLMVNQVLPNLAKSISDTLGREISPTRPVLLFLDNCSIHTGYEATTVAASLGIMMAFLPPNLTHSTQPLDVGIFGPFKMKYFPQAKVIFISLRVTRALESARRRESSRGERWCDVIAAKQIRPRDMPSIYAIGWAMVPSEAIVNSFRSTGIWPFLERVPLEAEAWCLAADAQEVEEQGTVAPHFVDAVERAVRDLAEGNPTVFGHEAFLAMAWVGREVTGAFRDGSLFKCVQALRQEIAESPRQLVSPSPPQKRASKRQRELTVEHHIETAKQLDYLFVQELESVENELVDESDNLTMDPDLPERPDPSRSPRRGPFKGGQSVDPNLEKAMIADLDILKIMRGDAPSGNITSLEELLTQRKEFADAYKRGEQRWEARLNTFAKRTTELLSTEAYESWRQGKVHPAVLEKLWARMTLSIRLGHRVLNVPSPRSPRSFGRLPPPGDEDDDYPDARDMANAAYYEELEAGHDEEHNFEPPARRNQRQARLPRRFRVSVGEDDS